MLVQSLFCWQARVTYPIHYAWKEGMEHVRIYGVKKRARERLHSLDREEKMLLSGYVKLNSRTMSLRLNDRAATSLMTVGILYRIPGPAPITGVPTLMSEWAWQYIHEHPQVLEGAEEPTGNEWMTY